MLDTLRGPSGTYRSNQLFPPSTGKQQHRKKWTCLTPRSGSIHAAFMQLQRCSTRLTLLGSTHNQLEEEMGMPYVKIWQRSRCINAIAEMLHRTDTAWCNTQQAIGGDGHAFAPKAPSSIHAGLMQLCRDAAGCEEQCRFDVDCKQGQLILEVQ